jgi:3-methyladenine DNA glycosylase AlkD
VARSASVTVVGAAIEQLEAALQHAGSAQAVQSLQRYFPDPVVALGVPNGDVARIAGAAYARDHALGSDDWVAVADHFARSHAYHEHLILASALVAKVARLPDPHGRLLALIKSWLEHDVSNWAQCDDLCIKPLYLYLKQRPHLLGEMHTWGTSESPWCRRASSVALVKFVGRDANVNLDHIFANCARLLRDEDPYVQKGIGWILKVTGQYHAQAVCAFLRTHHAQTARPTLRYAIEKLPAELRASFLKTAAPLPSESS